MAVSRLLDGWTKWGGRRSRRASSAGLPPDAHPVGWILIFHQPHSTLFRGHVTNWSNDIGIDGFVKDMGGPLLTMLAFGLGLSSVSASTRCRHDARPRRRSSRRSSGPSERRRPADRARARRGDRRSVQESTGAVFDSRRRLPCPRDERYRPARSVGSGRSGKPAARPSGAIVAEDPDEEKISAPTTSARTNDVGPRRRRRRHPEPEVEEHKRPETPERPCRWRAYAGTPSNSTNPGPPAVRLPPARNHPPKQPPSNRTKGTRAEGAPAVYPRAKSTGLRPK
jgi:hypothetical protein